MARKVKMKVHPKVETRTDPRAARSSGPFCCQRTLGPGGSGGGRSGLNGAWGGRSKKSRQRPFSCSLSIQASKVDLISPAEAFWPRAASMAKLFTYSFFGSPA